MSEAQKTAPQFVTSQASDKIELTAYQGGSAVVREKRVVTLPEGKSLVALEGLPEQFIQGSMTVVSVEGEGKFNLGPISYRPKSLSPQTILEKSIGKQVEFTEITQTGHSSTRGILKFILGNTAVVETSTGVQVVPISPRYKLIDGMPAGLTSKPSLVMEPTVAQAGEFGVNILYETSGIEWSSRYEAFYDAKNERLTRLVSWVDLSNYSGGNLKEAGFKLIAQANHGSRGNMRAMAMTASVADSPMGGGGPKMASFGLESAQVESVGEQKMYVLPDTLSLDHGESKQTALLMADNVPVTPEYFLSGAHYRNGARRHEDAQKLPVHLRLKLKNDKASNLGVALPPGEVVVFEADSSGAMQKTDSSNVNHVAQDEEFKLSLNNPTRDIKATRVLVDFRQDPEPPAPAPAPVAPATTRGAGPAAATAAEPPAPPAPRFAEETRELRLYNYKDKEVTVEVSEYFPREVEFLSNGEQFMVDGKQRNSVAVAVPAKGDKTVTYKIKYRIN